MSSNTTTIKPLYPSINKLMNKIDENKKLNNDKKLTCNNNYTDHVDSDNMRCPIHLDKSLILILDGKYMYDNKFNQEQYNCIPIALPIYSEEFIHGDNVCKIINCSKIYITIEKNIK